MKIKTIYILFIFIFPIISCKKENKINISELDVYNSSLKETIDNFITNTKTYPIESRDDILIYFIVDKNNDTIVDFYNRNPYECDNLINVSFYKGKMIYFYSSKNLSNKISTLIKIDGNDCRLICNQNMINNEVDIIYQESYTFKNGIIK